MEFHTTMKEIIIEQINLFEFSQEIVYEEKQIFSSNIEQSFKIVGRVPKSKEEKLEDFKNELICKLTEKIGANFVKENFDSIWQVGCGITVGSIFPTLELFNLNANKITFNTDNNKITLIDFWNINCQYCKPLMEKYVRFFEKKKDENKFVIVGISNDKNNQDWKKFIASQKWHTIPQYVKAGVTDSLGIIGVPFIVIVNKNKEVIYSDRAYKINVEMTLEQGEIVFTHEYSNEDVGNINFFEKNPFDRIKIVDEINQLFKSGGLNNIVFTVTVKRNNVDKREYRKVFAKLTGSRFKFDDEKFSSILEKIKKEYDFEEIQQEITVTESLVINADEDF
jgi:thiol-disulfide isomerase/thioredoxin